MRRIKFLLVVIAICGAMIGLTCCSKKPYVEPPKQLETDSFIVVDGKLDDDVWSGKKKMYIEYDGVQMNVTTTLGDKGFYVAYDVRDSRLYAVDGKNDCDNSGFEIYFDRSDAEVVSSQTHLYRLSLVGQNAYYSGNAESDWTQVDSLPIIGKYAIEGELNSGNSQGATGEIFVGWDALGYDSTADGFAAPTEIKLFPAYNRSSGSHMSDKREIRLSPTGNINSIQDYYLFDKDGYVQADSDESIIGDSLFGRVKTSGWDISKEADGEVKSIVAGDRFIYFRNIQKTDYAVTTKLKFDSTLSGNEPKAGLMLGADGNSLYSFVIDYSEEGMSSPRGQLLERSVGAYGGKEYRILGEYVAMSDIDLQNEVRLTGVKRGTYLYIIVGNAETDKFGGESLLAIFNCDKLASQATPGLMTVDSQAIFTDYAITDDADKISELLDGRVTSVSVKKNIDGAITEKSSEFLRGQTVIFDLNADIGFNLSAVKLNGTDVLNDPEKVENGKLVLELTELNYEIEYVYTEITEAVYRASGTVVIDADKHMQDVEITIIDKNDITQRSTCTLSPSGAFTVSLPNGSYDAVISCDDLSKTISFNILNGDYTFEPISLMTVTIRVENGATVNGKDGNIKVFKDEPIELSYSGEPGDGKFFDCYTVDGNKIFTDKIIPYENCIISVKLASNSSDMTWTPADEKQMSDVHGTKCYKLGATFDNWVLEYSIIHNVTGNSSVGVYLGGEYWAEIEVGEWGNKVHAHVPNVDWWSSVTALSQTIVEKLANAETTPVKVQWIRTDKNVSLLIDGVLVADISLGDNFGMQEFGTAYRGNADVGYVDGIRYVVGANKVKAFQADLLKIEIAEHDSKAKIDKNGEYTLPTATVKDGNGNIIADETVTITVKDIAGNNYTVENGKVKVDYRGAIDLIVTYAVGKFKNSCTVTVQHEDGTVFEASETGVKTVLSRDGNADITYDPTKKHGDDAGSMKIHVNTKRGDQAYALLNLFDITDYDYIEFYAYTDADGINTGALWYGDVALTKNEWTYVYIGLLNNEGSASNYYDGRWYIRLFDTNGGDVLSANVWLSSMRLIRKTDIRVIEIESHDDKVKIGESGEYTLPTANVKDGNGNDIADETVTITVKDIAGNNYTVNNGKVVVDYRGAIDLIVTYAVGKFKNSYTVTVQHEDGTVFEASETGVKTVLSRDGNADITYDPTVKHGDDAGSMKIHVNTIRGDQGYGLLNIYDKSGYDYLEFYAYTDTDGIQIGAWWYGDTNLRKDNWTYVRLELRDTNLYDGRWTIRLNGDNIASANVWLSSMRLIVREENVLASVYNVYPIEYDWYQHTGAASFEYVTDKKYIGDDTQVKDNGSLKITGKNPNGEEYSFLSGDTLAQVIDNYSSVYFYVYTDSDNTELKAGSWWCGDITIPKGVWTKVEFSLSANTNPDAVGGYDGQKIFSGDASAQRFAFRFQNLKEGDVIYVSSLYGVKAA